MPQEGFSVCVCACVCVCVRLCASVCARACVLGVGTMVAGAGGGCGSTALVCADSSPNCTVSWQPMSSADGV